MSDVVPAPRLFLVTAALKLGGHSDADHPASRTVVLAGDADEARSLALEGIDGSVVYAVLVEDRGDDRRIAIEGGRRIPQADVRADPRWNRISDDISGGLLARLALTRMIDR